MSSSAHLINDYIAGALGGMAGLIVGHPFDTTKVQMQTQQTTSPYKGTFDALKNINKHGMSKGFFRGMGFPLASYGVVNSVFFGVYGSTLKYLKDGTERNSSYREVYIAGCVGGFAQLFVACPVEVVKVVLQSQISKSSGAATKQQSEFFRGPRDCVRYIYQTRGIRGLYKGFTIQGIRDIPASTIYFLVYESMFKNMMERNWSDSHGVFASLFSGGMAGVISWFLIMPFDVVKSLYQADKDRMRYTSMWDCAKKTYTLGGPRIFFTGSVLACARAFPVNAVIFLVHNQSLKLIGFFSSDAHN